MPGWNSGRSATELSAMPISSAITIAGIGKTTATRGAAATAATATSDDSITPGRMLRSHVICAGWSTLGDAGGSTGPGAAPAPFRRKVASRGRWK